MTKKFTVSVPDEPYKNLLNQDKSILDVAVTDNKLVSFDNDTKVWTPFPYPNYFEQFQYPLTVKPTKVLLLICKATGLPVPDCCTSMLCEGL